VEAEVLEQPALQMPEAPMSVMVAEMAEPAAAQLHKQFRIDIVAVAAAQADMLGTVETELLVMSPQEHLLRQVPAKAEAEEAEQIKQEAFTQTAEAVAGLVY
jgi:hypothetical protein